MSKVLLIKATNNEPFLGNTQIATPPLGLMYIASVIRERSNHEVSIIDAQAENLVVGDTVKRVEQYKPDIVGISTLSLEAPYMYQLSKEIKKLRSDIKIIVGGPHATTGPKETLSNESVDFWQIKIASLIC